MSGARGLDPLEGARHNIEVMRKNVEWRKVHEPITYDRARVRLEGYETAVRFFEKALQDPSAEGQGCPACGGDGMVWKPEGNVQCSACHGSGAVQPPAREDALAEAVREAKWNATDGFDPESDVVVERASWDRLRSLAAGAHRDATGGGE